MIGDQADASAQLESLESVAKDHEVRVNALLEKFHADMAVLQSRKADQQGSNDVATREAEIARIKAELMPPA